MTEEHAQITIMACAYIFMIIPQNSLRPRGDSSLSHEPANGKCEDVCLGSLTLRRIEMETEKSVLCSQPATIHCVLLLNWNLPHVFVLLLVGTGCGICWSLLVRQNFRSAFAAVQSRLRQFPRLGHVLDNTARSTATTRRQIRQMWFTGRSLFPCSAPQRLVIKFGELLRHSYSLWIPSLGLGENFLNI